MGKEARHALQPLLVLNLGKGVFNRVDGVVIGEVKLGEVVALLGFVENVALLRRPVKNDIALALGEFAKRHVGAHAHLAGDLLHEVPHKRTPRQHRALVYAQRLVGYQGGAVHGAHLARALAGGAGAAGVE